MSTAQKIGAIAEQLTEREQTLLLELALRLLPDDVATQDDLEAIAAGREEYARGETIPLERIGTE
jgi:hypothetical protein